jgi:hypothetical protein
MSIGTQPRPAAPGQPAAPLAGPTAPARSGPLRDLDRPADAFASVGPNWFASVMGTGIVATAAATLPVQWPAVALYLGLVAAGLVVGVCTARGTWRGELLRPSAPAGNHADGVGRLTPAAE